MADALLTDLAKQLGSIAYQQALQEIQLLVGVDEEVEKLQEKLGIIQAVLDDAEERHAVKRRTEKRWLEQLKDKYYEMDDVLDTWDTARIRSQIQNEEEGEKTADSNAPAVEKKKKVWSFPSPSCCFNLPLRHDVGGKIKKLNETLALILKDRETLGINFDRQPELIERPITTSHDVDVYQLSSREKYRSELLDNLLGKGTHGERNPCVISLVGLGGIGKSTLAQQAYNHPDVTKQFPIRVWICVSDPFDECKVARSIIESVEGQSPNITQFQNLLDKICDLIKEKKFFLVLDDVWTEDFNKWKPFKGALTCGAQGSRILVTTRKETVAQMMGSAKTHIINLKELSDDDCWLIIRKIVFSDDNLEQHKDLEYLGKQLSIKCKGLPLAAKILGSHMCNKRTREEWERVLHSSLWELEDIGKGLLGPFFLSYYELSPAEKQCFLSCTVFPKDHPFNRLELVIHWMAQGYIDSKVDMEMEVIAEKYFESLAMRSFFQDFDKDEIHGRIVGCKMHDFVHEFAKSMTNDVCFTINGDNKVNKDFKKARQLSLTVKETIPEFVFDAKNLRFLNLNLSSSHTVLPKFFEHLTCLRTLHLKGEHIMKLPNEVDNLIHLRYLKLSCFSIIELPETICNFCNLQSLDVSESSRLKKLPQGMSKLIKLRYLSLSKEFIVFPKGIGKLTCLRTLSDFSIGGKDDKERCKLGELKNLNQLRGTLGIHGLRNVVDVGEVEDVQLQKKMHLRGLKLDFGFPSKWVEEEDKRRMENDVLVLNALEPPPQLEELTISYYMGTIVYPNWLMSLTTLKKLVLVKCWMLKFLPPLGKLQFLESLEIFGVEQVKKVGDEFLGIEESKKDDYHIIFPKLKSLHFEGLYSWEEWIGMGETREEEEEEEKDSTSFVPIKIMPRLHSLSITSCPKLKSLPDFLRTIQLQELQIRRSPILEQRCKPRKGED